jgi:hypothetical protein
MDQQKTERNSVSLDTVVTCTRFGMIRGRMKELGPDTMFIEARSSIVPIGADVSVTFQPAQLVSNACVSLKGVVMHQDDRGFGVKFVDVPPACRRALDRLMHEGGGEEAPGASSALRAVG